MSAVVHELRTERLMLRQWRESDRDPFAQLNSDPEAMRHFPSLLSREESDALALNISYQIEEEGWGLWAVEVIDGPGFVGFVGLNEPRFEAHFTPAVEVGWRLMRQHWGHGYATEAAKASVDFGFEQLELDEIVAMIAPANTRSRRVAERLDMTRDPADDFDHPRVPEGPLRRHALYRLKRPPSV